MANLSVLIISPDREAEPRLQTALGSTRANWEFTQWDHYPEAVELAAFAPQAADSFSLIAIDLVERRAALRLMRHFQNCNPRPVCLVMDKSRRLSSIVQAKRAGANGYLSYPTGEKPSITYFRNAPDQGDLTSRGADGTLLSFIPAQGGNGASTVSLHVADAVSRLAGGDTLLIDFDFHSGTVAFQLGLEPERHLGDVLEALPSDDIDWERWVCRAGQLHVLAAPNSRRDSPQHHLSRVPHLLAAAQRAYRYVIADLPNPLFSTSLEIMRSSELVYLLCTPEITSLHLARRKLNDLRGSGLVDSDLRLLVNRIGSWGSLETERVAEIVGLPVCWALDNDYAAVREAAWTGQLIPRTAPLAEQLFELGFQLLRPAVKENARAGRGRARTEARFPGDEEYAREEERDTSETVVVAGPPKARS